MFAASTAPSAAPAPIIVCISSINRIIERLLDISSMTLFILSSNSPRYFAPAIIEGRSRVTSVRPDSCSGTSPSAMSFARPSTTAVFPTPGSPMRQGLFFCLRQSIPITRSVSFSRPMVGSSLPAAAAAVRSRPYFERVGAPSILPPRSPLEPAPSCNLADILPDTLSR